MPLVAFKDRAPKADPSVFIAPTAFVIGDVVIGTNSSIFYSASVRGDLEPIIIGSGTNIQDSAVLHTSEGGAPCVLEDDVVVGHGAILHSCHVHSRSLIGMGAVVLDDAVIGSNSLIAAKSLVAGGTIIPEGVLALGSPAKIIRDLTEQEIENIRITAERYVRVAQQHMLEFS